MNNKKNNKKQFTSAPFPVTNQIIKKKKYFGIAEESFRGHLYNYKLSFKNESNKNDTELCKELWQIKMRNYTPEITWRNIGKYASCSYNTRKCYLSLSEKLEMGLYENENLPENRAHFQMPSSKQVHVIAL